VDSSLTVSDPIEEAKLWQRSTSDSFPPEAVRRLAVTHDDENAKSGRDPKQERHQSNETRRDGAACQ